MKKFVLFPGTTGTASVFRQDGASPATANWTNTESADEGGALCRHGTPRGMGVMEQVWGALNTTNGQLTVIGLILAAICTVAWRRSNRAEATPNPEQIEQIRHFVTGHFARYVARGLAAEDIDPASVDVGNDGAWQQVFIQHLRLNSELYAYRTEVAIDVFKESIDGAVRRELELRKVAAPIGPGAARV